MWRRANGVDMLLLEAQVNPPSKSLCIWELIIVLFVDYVLCSSCIDYYTFKPNFYFNGDSFGHVFIIKKIKFHKLLLS